MGVIFFLVYVCVRKHKSNLPTNIRTTVGKKTQWYVEKCKLWVKPNSSLILWQHGVFSFTKVCIFLPMVFIMIFITTVCVYDFCKTVLVKKNTPCQGMIWFSLTKVVNFTLAFMWELNYTIKAWLSLRKTWKNGSRALPSNSRRGLRALDPANPSSEKMTSQPTFFCCMYSPKV